MRKIIFTILILSICQGCSFIQEKFGNRQNPQNTNQEENQDQQRPSEPIPVNPQHS